MKHQDYLDLDEMSNSRLNQFKKHPTSKGKYSKKLTDALRWGRAADVLLFTPNYFYDEIEVIKWSERPAPKYKLGQVNLSWLEQLDKDHFPKTVITDEMFGEVAQGIEATLKNSYMKEVIKDGEIHPVYRWEDPFTKLKMKCELDVKLGSTVIDFKTSKDISIKEFRKSFFEYYLFQPAFYTEGAKYCMEEADSFHFAILEKETYDFDIITLDDSMVEYSLNQFRRNLNYYKQCKDENLWSKSIMNGDSILSIGI